MYRIEQFISNTKSSKRVSTSLPLDRDTALEISHNSKRGIKRGRTKNEQRLSAYVEDKHQSADASEELLLRSGGMCDAYALKPYVSRLQHVPVIVNVVSRVVTEPVPNSGTTLPLDLHAIATRCKGAYFWPVRFCPVQIAFHKDPRTRVLLFHTGKIVATGSKGPMSARLAVIMTLRKLAVEVGVYLKVASFEVKNLVGTVGLNATINCEGLAQRYSDKAHYDKSSFGGLQWRPFDKGICCEIFATGRMNLPNALSYGQLLEQFASIEPILVQYSSAGGKKACVAVNAQNESDPSCVGTEVCEEADLPSSLAYTHDAEDLWDGWI